MLPALRGSFRVFMLYDVSEQIRLDELRRILGSDAPSRQPAFIHPAPEYVRFERAPVIERLEPVILESGERFERRLKYFDYGVISVELELPFEADWESLVRLSNRWITAPEIETRTSDLMRRTLSRIQSAVVQPSAAWVTEDYYIIQISEARDRAGAPLLASALLSEHGTQLAQIVRGESQPLSDAETREALQSSLSYYPGDLIVAGWVAAIIYDSPEAAAPAIQLFEYANSQLLEYRYYDELLTRLLADVYKSLEKRGGLFRRWRMAREAEQLNTILLDIRELTERTDNAIKFLSDMFYARAYRIASERVGVTDYRNLVEQKLRTANHLYEFMVNQFHQGRAFVLEAMVVAILVVELANVFLRR